MISGTNPQFIFVRKIKNYFTFHTIFSILTICEEDKQNYFLIILYYMISGTNPQFIFVRKIKKLFRVFFEPKKHPLSLN